jgi:hypothetical protein
MIWKVLVFRIIIIRKQKDKKIITTDHIAVYSNYSRDIRTSTIKSETDFAFTSFQWSSVLNGDIINTVFDNSSYSFIQLFSANTKQVNVLGHLQSSDFNPMQIRSNFHTLQSTSDSEGQNTSSISRDQIFNDNFLTGVLIGLTILAVLIAIVLAVIVAVAILLAIVLIVTLAIIVAITVTLITDLLLVLL